MKKNLFASVAFAVLSGTAVFAQDSVETREKYRPHGLDYGIHAGIGITAPDDAGFDRAGFFFSAGADCAYDFGLFGVGSGLSFKRPQHRLKSELGGITGESDFKEKYRYNLSYLEVPVLLRLNCIRDVHIYAGAGVNFKLGGKARYERTGTGMKGVDDKSTYKIKNLNSTVFSVKIGADVMFTGRHGLRCECDWMLAEIYKNHDNGLSTLSFAYIFRF